MIGVSSDRFILSVKTVYSLSPPLLLFEYLRSFSEEEVKEVTVYPKNRSIKPKSIKNIDVLLKNFICPKNFYERVVLIYYLKKIYKLSLSLRFINAAF